MFFQKNIISIILLYFLMLNFRFSRSDDGIKYELVPRLEHLNSEQFGNTINVQMQNLVTNLLMRNETGELNSIIEKLTSDLADSFLHGVCKFSKELNPLNWIINFGPFAINDPLLNSLNAKINKFISIGCKRFENLVKTAKNYVNEKIRKYKLEIAEYIEAIMAEIFTDVVIIWINKNNNPSDKTIWTLMKGVVFVSKKQILVTIVGFFILDEIE